MLARVSTRIAWKFHSRLARGFSAVVVVAFASFLDWAMTRSAMQLPFYMAFYPAVLLAALLGSMWSGIFATMISALIVDYLLLPPIGFLAIKSLSDMVGLSIFCVSGISISIVTDLYHRNREKLSAMRLEAAVQNERRKVEEERRIAEALRQSQAKLTAALSNMMDAVIISDAEGRFVDFNDACAAFYRYKNKSDCARNFDEIKNILDFILPSGDLAPLETYPLQRAMRGESAADAEYILRRRDTGETWFGSYSFSPLRSHDGAIVGAVLTARDITRAKQFENERLIAIDFLALINQSRGTWDLVQRATAFFQERTGCEAVAIRLHDGKDVPYLGHMGFSPEFVQLECNLRLPSTIAGAELKSQGEANRQCLCGNVMDGHFDASRPFYTAKGSFWTNSTSELLANATEPSLPSPVRLRCYREGFESMALFPLFVGDERIGLLQMNDRHKGKFTSQSIPMWEKLAGYLATAISRFEAEAARLKSETQYSTLFNSMNEGLCIIEMIFDNEKKTSDFRFLQVNESFVRQTGLHNAEGRLARDLLPGNEFDWFDIFGKVALTGVAIHFESEVKALNRYFAVKAYRVGDPDQRRVAVLFSDISETKRAVDQLRESKELLGLFIEHAPAALAMFDDQLRYLYASQRWTADFGLDERDLHGLSLEATFPEIPKQWQQAHRRAMQGELLSENSENILRANERELWVRWEIRPWREAGGRIGGIVIFVEDIGKQKRAEAALLRSEKEKYQRQQLQALAKQLQQVREEERKMLSLDLHDQIGQLLTGIKLDITWVMRHLPEPVDDLHHRIGRSIELINDGIRSVRRICSGLRPGILDDLGLAAAIEWQSNEFAARTGIPCQISIPDVELNLDGNRATAIFRIFQECLTNITRHAEAKSVHGSLSEQNGELHLIVADDGKGFCDSIATDSLGLLGMKERAQGCGGSAQIASIPGSGTTVTVRVPAHAPDTEAEDYAYIDR